jgi:prophage tail gpP-like protein
MIIVRSNGIDLEGFSVVKVTDNVDTLCNQFTLETSADEAFKFPIPRGSDVEILINDVVVLTGELEQIRGSSGDDKYKITGNGRDKTKAILKTDLDPAVSLKGPMQLKRAIELTLEYDKIDLDVIDEVGDLDDFDDKELLTDSVGAKLFDFYVALAEKRQALITRDRASNIVIRRPNTRKYRKTLTNLINDPLGLNNIITNDFDFNDADRTRTVNIYSQERFTVGTKPATETVDTDLFPEQNVEPKSSDVQADAEQQLNKINYFKRRAKKGSQADRVLTEAEAEIKAQGVAGFRRSRVASKGTVVDNAVTDGVIHRTAEYPSTNAECEKQAKWEVNSQRVKSNSYSCTVSDVIADTEVWESGYLIDVIDEFAGVASTMMIQSVTFSDSMGEDGEPEETITLAMTIPDGYTEDATPDATLEQTGAIGEGWNIDDFK